MNGTISSTVAGRWRSHRKIIAIPSFLDHANIVVWRVFISIYRAFPVVKAGGSLVEEDLSFILAHCGFLGRIFRGRFRPIDRSWQIFWDFSLALNLAPRLKSACSASPRRWNRYDPIEVSTDSPI
jgi:hypothetical protein